jgi:hypothetical protein
VMGAGRDAGQLADAALHKVGQRLGLGSPQTQRRAAPPIVLDSPPSTTGSSQDLNAAASLPLPGGHTATAAGCNARLYTSNKLANRGADLCSRIWVDRDSTVAGWGAADCNAHGVHAILAVSYLTLVWWFAGEQDSRPEQNGGFSHTPRAQMLTSRQEVRHPPGMQYPEPACVVAFTGEKSMCILVLMLMQGANGVESPLVARGLIFNERTGKTIKIGAATYNKLILEGYTPDRAAGVLTPPVAKKGTLKNAGDFPAMYHLCLNDPGCICC